VRNKIFIALGVIAVCWLVVHLFKSSPATRQETAVTTLEQKTARCLAEAAAATAGKGGDVLVILPATDGPEASEVSAALLHALEKSCVRIAGTAVWPEIEASLKNDRMALAQYVSLHTDMDAAWLAEQAVRQPGVKAVICLVGEPVDATGRVEDYKDRIPPVFCVARDTGRTATLIRAGIVRMALMPNSIPVTGDPGKKWFETLYRKVTLETLDAWQKDQAAGL
jgi:hypothetical protein